MIVSNASPLHYLILTGNASLLPTLYERVIIPAAVRAELLRAETPLLVREWISYPPEWLDIHADPSPPVAEGFRDVGEGQAIALAMALGVRGILLDDRKARTQARSEGLLVVGTLGVLDAAADQGLIEFRVEAEKLLQETNFRIDPKLVRALMDRRRETGMAMSSLQSGVQALSVPLELVPDPAAGSLRNPDPESDC